MADTGFYDEVYEVVRQVPEGRVTTYGQVAALLGRPRASRAVGYAMHASPGMAAGVPCHRVVFRDGTLAHAYAFGGEGVQREMLEREGIHFLPNGRVDLAAHLWEAEP